MAAFRSPRPSRVAQHGHCLFDLERLTAERAIGAADVPRDHAVELVSQDMPGDPACMGGWCAFLGQCLETEPEQVRQHDTA